VEARLDADGGEAPLQLTGRPGCPAAGVDQGC